MGAEMPKWQSVVVETHPSEDPHCEVWYDDPDANELPEPYKTIGDVLPVLLRLNAAAPVWAAGGNNQLLRFGAAASGGGGSAELDCRDHLREAAPSPRCKLGWVLGWILRQQHIRLWRVEVIRLRPVRLDGHHRGGVGY